MSANVASLDRRKQRQDIHKNSTESTVNSTDAIDMISHSSELTINITTPVGTKYMGKARFIGTHSDNLILIEPPVIAEDDFNYFFQEGFWINVRAISQKGEGAIINFRSQILHITDEPLQLVMVSIPGMMKINQLRKEPRYDVNLRAKVFTDKNKTECEIRDLSKGGCRFITSALNNNVHVGDKVALEVITHARSKVQLLPLEGTVCNLQSSTHYSKYGLMFDEIGQANVKALLSNLKFDGTKLALKI